jgi:hypothetical protein
VTAHEPEPQKGSDQAEGLGRISVEQPLDGRAHVFALGREPFESLDLARAVQLAIQSLGEREVVLGMTVADLVGE